MIFKRFIGFVVFVFLIHTAKAQNKTVTHENQQWIQYYDETKLNKNWTLLADASFRWRDGFSENAQFIARTGLGYSIKENLRISAGFAYSSFYTQDTLNRVEYRPHQEILLRDNFNKIRINQRIRVEERFFNPLNNPNNTFNFRFRYQIMVSLPLFKLSKSNPDSMFLLNVGDEIFINAGKETPTQTFDQNRFVVSPVFQLNKNLSISPTWNSQYASTATSGTYRHTNVFWLQIRHNLDLSESNTTE
jgi:Protein of unknown function (DUF2490)